jgi:hypothetical protein
MTETILNSSWSMSLANLPSYGLMLVSAPVVSFLAIKILLLAKAASGEKKSREWVFTQERDENGMPALATAKARSSRFHSFRSR